VIRIVVAGLLAMRLRLDAYMARRAHVGRHFAGAVT
jgi:hypothetical protein